MTLIQELKKKKITRNISDRDVIHEYYEEAVNPNKLE